VRARLAPLAVAAVLAAGPAFAQPAPPDPVAVVRERDAAFWRVYNACDVAGFEPFFTRDVEFYHDRGGPLAGWDALARALESGLCGGGSRTRRAPVEDTVRISILKQGDAVYGAIVAGEHQFYVTQPGRPESLDGHARFANLWRLQDGAWRMSRILSYDHGPPPKP
jgi:hypothetical protein